MTNKRCNKYFEFAKLIATIGSFLLLVSSICFSTSQNAYAKMSDYNLELNLTDVEQIYHNIALLKEQRDSFDERYVNFENYGIWSLLAGFICLYFSFCFSYEGLKCR